MNRFEQLLADFDAWSAERGELSEHDGEFDGPAPKDWERSDDVAFELLEAFAAEARKVDSEEEP